MSYSYYVGLIIILDIKTEKFKKCFKIAIINPVHVNILFSEKYVSIEK